MGIKESITWADITWNPVWGCRNNCPFCYARKFANRFYKKIADKEIKRLREQIISHLNENGIIEKIKNYEPMFLVSNFEREFPKNPSRIFVNSMSDIAFWEPAWMALVLEKIKKYPQHIFLFLTKEPLNKYYIKMNFYKNILKGVTITDNEMLTWSSEFDFLSIEPIQERILFDNHNIECLKGYKWIIVGAETGNRKNKIVPKKEWIEDIRLFCQDNDIPYFEKNSLREIVDRELIQEWPG
jgi:protein gp37